MHWNELLRKCAWVYNVNYIKTNMNRQDECSLVNIIYYVVY